MYSFSVAFLINAYLDFSLQATYDQTLSKIKMVRHVFQALILGSGVNWGADKATMDLMISLGKPIEQQLEPV